MLINKNTFSNKLLNKYIYWSGIITLLFILITSYVNYVNKHFPEQIYITEQSDTSINLSLPVTGSVHNTQNGTNNSLANADFSREVTFITGSPGSYHIDLHLFGFLFLKTVNVNVVDEKYVYPCGFQAGLYLKSSGILVVKTDSIESKSSGTITPCENIITKGDYILKINDEEINSKKQLSCKVNECAGEKLNIELLRNDEIINVTVTPVEDKNSEYKLGLWVKDDAQGIGTITYIDTDYNYAALGHPITDNTTGKALNIKYGRLYNTRILSIIKGQNGTPGELQGIIDYKNSTPIGTIDKNSSYGIYGTIDNSIVKKHSLSLMSVGYRYSVHKGKAYVRFYRNNKYDDYEIKITQLNNNDSKNISFVVISEELLDMTNGIVQGMSGCPIIQDGKIIGAVTHVLIDDSRSGYGIYIENMLNAS